MPPPSLCRTPIRPERVRAIAGQSFAFLPHRFLREGFLCSLSASELQLYVFLVLAADRNGLSFYSFERICATLETTLDRFLEARNALIDKDLIAFDGTRFQVLSLPHKPLYSSAPELRTDRDFEEHDRATVRQAVFESLADAGRK